ncbi:uncharacterized protein LOC142150753 [Mixophyes fleayi]|uniref:uncharacterized protein LOC142150753 n=1 Tax=Mixophyes fleayi TaxID=3061075 RepID=UPI003F4DF01A
MNMKKCTEDHRQLKQQQFSHQIMSLSNSSGLKLLPGGVHLKGSTDSDSCLEKNNFRYPRREHLKPALEHHILERPIVRRITVDLRPILRQVIDACEVDISDTSSAISSELSEQGIQIRKERVEAQSPPQKNTEPISFSLPSISNCKSCKEQSRPVKILQRRASLVAVTDEGTLTCDAEHRSSNCPLVAFPKVILKPVPMQKSSKEQRPSRNENMLWVDVDKLQLPMSELVKVVKERTDSGQHTIIAQVLCSLREKQEKAILQDVGVFERTRQETAHKTPHVGGGIRLTWRKRN